MTMQPGTPQLWLAPPDAALRLDTQALSTADAARWLRLRGGRKAVEWAASRALRAQLAPPPDAATSLSHSAGHAALAVGPGGSRIGVDIEAVEGRDVLGLAGSAFATAEAEALRRLDGASALRDFYLRWTLKEAFAKALGIPLLQALRDCVVSPGESGWTASVPTEEPWHASVYAVRPQLVLAAVVVGEGALRAQAWVCSEWPTPSAVGWTPLARLSSESALAQACALPRLRAPRSCRSARPS